MSTATAPRPTRAAVARALEREVLAGCVEACRALGIPVDRQNTGLADHDGRRVRYGRKGNADLTGTIPRGPHQGKRLEIEVKRPGARPRPEQLARLAETRAAGGIAFWISDAGDCLRVLLRVVEDGARIEVDEDGTQWVAWDDPPAARDPEGG